jgi:hypothetical protein
MGLTLRRGTRRKACELLFMKICDLCRKTANRLHLGPKAAESVEVCDACEHDLMVRITKLQQEEAKMRETRWAAMIEDWKRTRVE